MFSHNFKTSRFVCFVRSVSFALFHSNSFWVGCLARMAISLLSCNTIIYIYILFFFLEWMQHYLNEKDTQQQQKQMFFFRIFDCLWAKQKPTRCFQCIRMFVLCFFFFRFDTSFWGSKWRLFLLCRCWFLFLNECFTRYVSSWFCNNFSIFYFNVYTTPQNSFSLLPVAVTVAVSFHWAFYCMIIFFLLFFFSLFFLSLLVKNSE